MTSSTGLPLEPVHETMHINKQRDKFTSRDPMAEVSFICKRTVVNTKPVPPGKYSPLSVLDQAMERNNLRMVFYYQLPTVREAGELTAMLRDSMAEMLSHFPAVVGRLLRSPEGGHWMVKCNDAGVRTVEAKAEGTVEEWLRTVDREQELKLIHWEEMSHKPYFWSPFYVQITEFEGGGLAIGLSCTHLLSDPIGAAMMIKAWADMTLGGNIGSPPLFHPLPSRREEEDKNNRHQPNCKLIDHYKSAFEKPVTASNVKTTTLTLEFKQEMVKSCIEMVEEPNDENQESPIMPFQALCVLFWICISRVKGKKGSLVDMAMCLDARNVLGLDKGFFGNCLVYNKVQGTELNESEICKVGAAIKEASLRMGDEETIMDLIEWLQQEKFENPPWMTGHHLIFANLESVDFYDAVFEDKASPHHVSCYIEPVDGAGQVLILPSSKGREDSGRVVMVTLEDGEAKGLLNDSLIKKFSPSILISFINDAKLHT